MEPPKSAKDLPLAGGVEDAIEISATGAPHVVY